jgi:single-strand DNA-binding protein
MNKFIGIGVIGRDVELKTTQSGKEVANFPLALKRNYKDSSGEYGTDWVNCVAWGNTGSFIAKYFSKGSKIAIDGSIQSRSYEDKNGTKRTATEVNVANAEFVEKKSTPAQQAVDDGDFQLLDDDENPF